MDRRSLTMVADGLLLPESPRWHADALWFVDMLRGNVHRLVERELECVVQFDRPSSIGFLPNGDLLVAEATTSALHVLRGDEPVDIWDLSMWGSVNDMAVDSQGRAYIDGRAGSPGRPGSVQDGWEPTGQILLAASGEEPRVVADGLVAPNGIAISPDEKLLVVGESMGRDGSPNDVRLIAYDIEADGSLMNERVHGTIDRGCGDGLCFDAEGAVWVGTAYGHDIRRFVEGDVVDRIVVPDRKWPLAVALGGSDLRTMFVCNAAAPANGDPSKFSAAWIETLQVDVPGPIR